MDRIRNVREADLRKAASGIKREGKKIREMGMRKWCVGGRNSFKKTLFHQRSLFEVCHLGCLVSHDVSVAVCGWMGR